jgi:hypothetical protein
MKPNSSIKSINPKYDIGNSQSPEVRTIHTENFGNIRMQVCDDELWRLAQIKRDIEAGRYANLKPADLAQVKKAKRKKYIRK